ncbi:hypothetical protein ACFWC2_14395 [Streptomyces diastaticus]|uniref:hypothetical protein n=1 Tax=Streptomyces diastaticus TaxID=1956 RepID=UPI0033CBBFD2
MSFLDSLLARDRRLAETTYAGRKSATETAAEKTRARRSRSAGKAAASGQAWDAAERRRENQQ